jgi:glycogen synthase
MHICLASLDYPDITSGGGVGTYVKIIAHEMIKRGHRVSVIALKKGKERAEASKDEGVNIYWITPGNIHWYFSKVPIIGKLFALSIREIEYSDAVLKAIRIIDSEEPIDIVEGIETGACGFKALRSGIKTVIRLHGERYTFAKYTPPGHVPLDVRMSRYLQRMAFRNANQLTAPSQPHADEICSELKHKCTSIKVIQNPIRVFDFEGNEKKDHDQPLFLYVGRLERRKGLIPLLKAIPKISNKVPKAKFIFAGNKHPSITENEIECLIDNLGIRKSVEFYGHVSADELKLLYSKASVVVLPSYYETFGYVYFEALLYCRPIIAFDTGTAGEFIIDGKNGFLVPVDDIGALADACIKAISMEISPPDRDEISKYSVERVCSEMISVYENLLCNN